MNADFIELSIVVPMHNESAGIDAFFARFEALFATFPLNYEIICVNDGSRDDTLARLLAHNQRDPRIKVIDLSRNFGKETALTAGLDHCRGATVVPIDADLQDPPELIPEMLAKWREGYDVVYATRRIRHGETATKRATAGMFYRVLNWMSEIDIPANTGDFRLMDRRVVEALRQLPERTRFMKGLFAWVGFKQTAIYYDRDPRFAGQSQWSYWKLWTLALDGVIAFSVLPLKVWGYIGLLLSLGALVYAGLLVLTVWMRGIDVPGYASMMVVVLFLGGVQLMSLGIIGEYLARIYTEVKRRPLYLIRGAYGVRSQPHPEPCQNPFSTPR